MRPNEAQPDHGTSAVPQPTQAASTTARTTAPDPTSTAALSVQAAAAAEAAAVAKIVSRYRPRTVPDDLRDELMPLVREWVTTSLPCSRGAAERRLNALTGLLVWCAAEGIALRRETVLREATVERYIATALAGAPGNSRATIRSTLRNLTAALLPTQARTPAAAVHGVVSLRPPYSGAEVTGLLNLAKTQPTQLRSENVTALLLAGLGAGLGATELNVARGDWVTTDDHGVVVVHVGGPRMRTVPVLSRYAPALLAAGERTAQGWLLGGADTNRGSRVGFLAGSLTAGADVPHLVAGRLRATWLLELLAGQVRVDVICQAAGLANPRLLADLFAHLPTLPAADVRTALTGRRVNR